MGKTALAVESGAPLAEKILHVLDGDMHEQREEYRAFLASPEMQPPPAGTPTAEYREITFNQLLHFIDSGIPDAIFSEEYGGEDDLIKYLNFVDLTGHQDPSFGVKQGVNFALCVGALSKLGTEKHFDRFYEDFRTGKITGGLALTEVGGGSNVQNLQTEAIYDPQTREFILNTPTPDARKAYIGNAAQHGDYAVVYAQLIINGESKGPHGFIVPLRDKAGNLTPGVQIEDCGEKVGLNGVDNGYMGFDQVRVPYDSMLDKLAQINENHEYQTEIENPGVRFIKTIGALVTGRVLVGSSAISSAQNGLKTAVDFAVNRDVTGGNLMDKKAHQEDLFGHLAKIYAGTFAKKALIAGAESGTREFDDFATAMKFILSDYAYAALDRSRLAVGGAAYMAEKKVGKLRNDHDISRTFEGANTALRLFSARNQLKNFGKAFAKASGLQKINIALIKPLTNRFNTLRPRANTDHLLDPDFQMATFEKRENAMRLALASKANQIVGQNLKYAKIMAREPLSKDQIKEIRDLSLAEFGDQYQIELREYANAYAEKLLLEQFITGVQAIDDPETKAALKDLCDLYAVSIMDEHSKWFLENNYMRTQKTKRFIDVKKSLYDRIRVNAQDLVDGFGIPEELLELKNPLKQPVNENQYSAPVLV